MVCYMSLTKTLTHIHVHVYSLCFHRATISNMCPEYGATVGFFPVDGMNLLYMKQTARDSHQIAYVEAYLKAVDMFRNYNDEKEDPIFSEVRDSKCSCFSLYCFTIHVHVNSPCFVCIIIGSHITSVIQYTCTCVPILEHIKMCNPLVFFYVSLSEAILQVIYNVQLYMYMYMYFNVQHI